MYKYHDPSEVVSPRYCIEQVETIFDGGTSSTPFSLAIVTWDGQKRIGIRWNVTYREWDDADKIAGTKVCVGEPNSRGYPTWFILPDELLLQLLAGNNKITEAFKRALDEIAGEHVTSHE